MQKWKLWSTEKRSSRVLYALVGLIIIVFALFWLIGFDRPFDDDPNFNSPLFTDALLIVTALIFLFGVGLAVLSVVRSARTIGKSDRTVNNIPVPYLDDGVGQHGGSNAALICVGIVKAHGYQWSVVYRWLLAPCVRHVHRYFHVAHCSCYSSSGLWSY